MGDLIVFEADLVWVRLAHCAAIDGGGAEVTFDSAREEMREGDAWVLDGKSLIEAVICLDRLWRSDPPDGGRCISSICRCPLDGGSHPVSSSSIH
jgi:hypothetical protein